MVVGRRSVGFVCSTIPLLSSCCHKVPLVHAHLRSKVPAQWGEEGTWSVRLSAPKSSNSRPRAEKNMFSCRHGKGPWPNLVTDPKSTPSVHGLAPTKVQYGSIWFNTSSHSAFSDFAAVSVASNTSLMTVWLLSGCFLPGENDCRSWLRFMQRLEGKWSVTQQGLVMNPLINATPSSSDAQPQASLSSWVPWDSSWSHFNNLTGQDKNKTFHFVKN